MAAPFLVLDIVRVDARKNEPIYRQIYSSIRNAILTGKLGKSDPLPSTRELAVQLGLSRMTVVNAYDQLTAEGYLTSTVGSGTFVSEDLPEEQQMVKFRSAIQPAASEKTVASSATYLSKAGKQFEAAQSSAPEFLPGKLLPFRPGVPALDEFPKETWSKICRTHWKSFSDQDLSYGHSAGYLPLRKSIAEYVRAFRGVRCTQDQVMIVSGTQQAIDVSSRLLVDPGDKVLFENPGYPTARAALLAAGAKVVPMPVDKTGARVDDGIGRAPDARMVYVTPSHQYPLGVTLPIERRMELINWAQQNNSLIIEDDYDSEYRYAQKPIPSLQGLDQAERTVYIGSFSKTIFPALGIGYAVVPPAIIPAFESALGLVARPPAMLDQIILNDFIEQGHFGRHLRRMRKIHQERRTVFVESVSELLDDKLEIVGSDAGLHCTAFLNTQEKDTDVAKRISDAGVIIRSLSDYCVAEPGTKTDSTVRNGLIFGFACAKPTQIRNAVKRIVGCF